MGPLISESAELLSTLFNTGELPLEQAFEVMHKSGGLHRMARLEPQELAELSELSLRCARRIGAAITLGRAALTKGDPFPDPLTNSEQVYTYLAPRVGWPEVEEFWVLALDVRQRPMGLHLVARGSIHEVNLTLAGVFRHLVRSGAPRGICLHTHPSGEPSPSDMDLTLTDRIVQTAALLGIEVVDHIIMGQGAYCSLADKGYI